MEDLILGLISGAGVCLLATKIGPRVLRAWGVHIPKKMDEWQEEVERTAIAVIHADLDAARTKARLVELIGEIPKDFDPSAFLGCHIAAAVQREVLMRAEQEGLIEPGVADRMFSQESRTNMSRLASSEVATYEEPPVAYGTMDEAPNVRRIRGKLLPMKRSKIG
jgi:hypothetical protein